MKRNSFLMSSLLLMMIYLCGTLSYYSQIYCLEKYYDGSMITSFISGWNYLAQAVGIMFFVLLAKRRREMVEKPHPFCICILTGIPVLAVSVTTSISAVRIGLVLCNNILIGFATAFAFYLIVCVVEKQKFGICFALAYALGGIGTWIISECNVSIMSTWYVVFPYTVLVLVTIAVIYIFRWWEISFSCGNSSEKEKQEISLSREFESSAEMSSDGMEKDESLSGMKTLFMLFLVIALMAILTALGSNDPILAESGNQIDFLTTRLYYAGGLLLAGFLFDRNPVLEGICSLGALLYPLMATILYYEFPGSMIVIGLSDTFLAFYAVWRAGIFMRLAGQEEKKRWISSLGLCVSRVIEGIMILFLCMAQPGRLQSFLATGILFSILLVVSALCLQEWVKGRKKADMSLRESVPSKYLPVEEVEKDYGVALSAEIENGSKSLSRESRRAVFAEQYHLTRREEEITEYLAENMTNGEIASVLNLSESTVRFHVSNILKKTEMKNRSEVSRAYSRTR